MMRKIGGILGAVIVLFFFTSALAQTAQVRMTCYSLRFHPGTGPGGNTLELGTSGSNGELFPIFGQYTHASGFVLDDDFLPIDGVMYLNVPLGPDANDNGFNDFFEVAQGVGSTVTSGNYETWLTDGTVQATWSRAAGSTHGQCVLRLVDDAFGDLGNYFHTFELLESQGPLNYTPGVTNVTGVVNLARVGSPAETLQGPVSFIKSLTNPVNELVIQAGYWTNATAQALSFMEEFVERDLTRPTNYYGFMVFDDGDLNTPAADYQFWELSIDDSNDANGNGIPDFSDTPGGVPRKPLLSLARGTGNLTLTISGEVGRLHHIQRVDSLSSTNWETALSVTLTNDPQTVTLALPGAPRFWRAAVSASP